MTLPKLGRRATLSTACSRSSVTTQGLESVMEAIIARMPGVASGIPGGAPGPDAAAAAAQMSPTETAAAAAEAAQAAMANYQDVAALQVSVRALALGMQQQGCEQTYTPPTVSRAQARAPSSTKVSNKGRLPDSVTSTLLDWFMANVLHPFPNAKQKDSLMSQTGLSRIQLKNWLTNLRKRHWTPVCKKGRAARSHLELLLAEAYGTAQQNETATAPSKPAPRGVKRSRSTSRRCKSSSVAPPSAALAAADAAADTAAAAAATATAAASSSTTTAQAYSPGSSSASSVAPPLHRQDSGALSPPRKTQRTFM